MSVEREIASRIAATLQGDTTEEELEALAEAVRPLCRDSGGHVHVGDWCSLQPPCREARRLRLV